MASPSATVASPTAGKGESAFRINPATLAEKFLTSLGISCILAEPVAGRGDRVRIVVRGVEARKSSHPKIWVRSAKEAERLRKELMSGCKQASMVRGALQIEGSATVAIDMIRVFAQLNAIRPIKEADLVVTFDSVLARLKKQLDQMQRSGAIRLIRQQYQELVLASGAKWEEGTACQVSELSPSIVPSAGTSSMGQSRDNGTNGTKTVPEYLDWVVSKLQSLAPIGCIHAIVIDTE